MDEETLKLARSYAGRDFDKPHGVEVKAFGEYAEAEWMLDEFLADINDAVASIPEESKRTARVVLRGCYEETGRLEIVYRRLETDEEVADRVQRAFAYAMDRQEKERAEFERLKAKFGD